MDASKVALPRRIELNPGDPAPPGTDRNDSPAPPPGGPPVGIAGDASPSVFQPATRNHGRPWIWSTAAGLIVIGAMLLGILGITFTEGLAQFWPSGLVELKLKDGTTQLGEVMSRGEQQLPGKGVRLQRRLVRVGNREVTGVRDFIWIDDAQVISESVPGQAWKIERMENGTLYGTLAGVTGAPDLAGALERGTRIRTELERVRREMGTTTDQGRLARLEKRRTELEAETSEVRVTWKMADGTTTEVKASAIVDAFQPNAMGLFRKMVHYMRKLWGFFTEDPRESNTEGGIFPVIMGTLFLVITMTLAAVPLGVMAAIYLHEYAKDNAFLRLVRLAVANLAGVPSIVFGIFGLGLFVYAIGGSIDRTFYADRGSPTFGTGGILWGALTLALLTVPVVIVATGEGLKAVPRAYRDGAIALGATRWQTIWNVVIPQSMPGILTGTILAIGRGAGEVAPLMVMGAAVKLAPQGIVDSAFPFMHLDRKFLHLGFHIYDVSMQSPNVEAAKPMTYASTLTLMLMVLLLNLVAIIARNRLKKRFQGAAL